MFEGNEEADSKAYPREESRALAWSKLGMDGKDALFNKIYLWLYRIRKMKTARRYRFRDTVLLQGYFLLT